MNPYAAPSSSPSLKAMMNGSQHQHQQQQQQQQSMGGQQPLDIMVEALLSGTMNDYDSGDPNTNNNNNYGGGQW
jgi:hypothetical protein